MNFSRVTGFSLLVIGVVLQPIGWMYFTEVTAVSFLAIVVGVLLLFRARNDEEGGGDDPLPRPTGREMPGDINDYSGQSSGGRSESWKSTHSGDFGDTGNSGD